MKTKKCIIEPPPPSPPPDLCKEQRIQQKIKAGIKICPREPVIPPTPPPPCHALCIERIKNLPVEVSHQPVVCVVEREETGQARCDMIRDLKAMNPDLPWPGCQPPAPPPPPREPNLCELQERRAKMSSVRKERRGMKCKMDTLQKSFSSNLDASIEKFREETIIQSEKDFKNTRKMTTETPCKALEESSYDIDRKITDLENHIKHLQGEIVGMSKEAKKPPNEESLRERFTKAHCDLKYDDTCQHNKTNLNIDSDKKSKNSLNNRDQDNNCKAARTNSYVFSVIMPNINPLIKDEQYKDIDNDFLDHIHTPNISELEDNFAEIRKNFSLLWNDVDDTTEENDEDLVTGPSVKCKELRDETGKISRKSSGIPL